MGGGRKVNVKKSFLAKLLCGVSVMALFANAVPQDALAASVPVYHDIPAYQQRDIFETETVKISGITVTEIIDGEARPVEKPIQFKIFNTVKQELEDTVQSENGVLPTLNLIKNHNYMIYAVDSEYTMTPPAFGWVKDGKLLNIKENVNKPYNYPEITNLQLSKRQNEESNPENDRRCLINLDVLLGEGPMANVTFKLVSDVETIEAKTNNSGKLRAELLEEVTYMVTVDNSNYTVDSFPIAVKDKSEYGGVRYSYDHSDCKLVEKIQLIDKKDAHKNDKTVTSLSEDTTITGFNFKDFIVVDRKMDKDLGAGWEDKEYDVIDIKVVNPHRWEISKLAAGDFKISERIAAHQVAEHVYYIDKEDQLHEIDFEQIDNQVNFTMNSLSMYPVVIEYNTVKAPLKAVIREAEALNCAVYTEESWALYREALEEAKRIVQKPDATSEEVNQAVEKVNRAKQALVLAPIKVSRITINGESKKIAAGKKIQLTSNVEPSNASNKSVVWTTSNKKYATVDATGKVTTKKAGAGKTVKITASARDGSGQTAVYQIKIMKDAVKSIKLTAKTSVKAGKSITVKATVKMTGKNANKKLIWSTSNKNYATVNSKGKVATKKAGKGKTVKITAKATDGSGKKKTVKIKIK